MRMGPTSPFEKGGSRGICRLRLSLRAALLLARKSPLAPLFQRGGSELLSVALLLIAAPTSAATLRGIRPIAGPSTTLIIVELSDVVSYRVTKTEAQPRFGVPPRVQIDLQRTQLLSGLHTPESLSAGPVKRVRVAQPAADSARVLIDVD